VLLLSACAPDYAVTPEKPDVDPGDVTECGFTRVEETDFYAYDCNPVFTTTGEDWAPSVSSTAFAVTEVLGHPFYQLWYVAYNEEEEWNVGYAVSPDGVEWTPWEDNPVITYDDKAEFDQDVMQGNQVVWDPDSRKYVMLYSGLHYNGEDSGFGVMKSQDGRGWERTSDEAVLLNQPTDVDGVSGWCWPLDVNLGRNGGFDGYIAGGSGSRDPVCQAYRLGGSADAADWSVQEEPIFTAGEDDAWDDTGFTALNIATLGDADYLFYVGFGEWTRDRENNVIIATNAYLGWAQSDDGGDSWERDPDPIPINQTEDGEVSAVAAVTVESRIHLWVTDNWDGEQAVGYFLYDPGRTDTGG
jgi:hypothetical protein